MPWFKVDDKLHDHRKTRAAGLEPMGLWVIAGSWSSDNLTDGFVPADVIGRWGRTAERCAARLVDAGYWHTSERHGEQGWQFHDWEGFQPMAEQVLAQRAAAAERQRKARDKARESRSSHAVTHSEVTPVVTVPPTRPDPTIDTTPPTPPVRKRRRTPPEPPNPSSRIPLVVAVLNDTPETDPEVGKAVIAQMRYELIPGQSNPAASGDSAVSSCAALTSGGRS